MIEALPDESKVILSIFLIERSSAAIVQLTFEPKFTISNVPSPPSITSGDAKSSKFATTSFSIMSLPAPPLIISEPA